MKPLLVLQLVPACAQQACTESPQALLLKVLVSRAMQGPTHPLVHPLVLHVWRGHTVRAQGKQVVMENALLESTATLLDPLLCRAV